MKINTLTNLILAAVATAGMSTAAFADDNARFETQLTVNSVNNCQFTVTAENGTAITATYKYTAADQAAGTFGTTSFNTTAPLTVLVSSGSDSCPLSDFTVATTPPGIKIAKNTAGLPTHDGGVWPIRWVYTRFDAYDDIATTNPSQADTAVGAGQGGLQVSAGNAFTTNASRPDVAVSTPVFVTLANAGNETFGTYESGFIPGILLGHGNLPPVGGSTIYTRDYGVVAAAALNDSPTTPTPRQVTPPGTSRAVRIGLSEILATFPYATTTKAPDPLTVFDTVNGSGVPLTGTGTMTITAL